MNIATSVEANRMNAYQEIYEQYVDNASFLWILRSIAVDQPHYDQHDLLELEQRIEAQLDGLMTSIELAWPVCQKALELEEPGEVFTAAVLAFRSHDPHKIQQTVEAGLSNDESIKGLISAIGWLPGKLVSNWINRFLSSKDLNHKYLAIAACSVRRENPEVFLNRILDREDCRNHLKLYCRSLRLIGELRRLDLMPYLEHALQSDNEEVLFWALWSSVLLGNHSNALNLSPYVFTSGKLQSQAINLIFRVLPVNGAREIISRLSKDKEQDRNVIKASGVLGDPHAINWLISRMQDSNIAKLAGESFSFITGVDLTELQLVDNIKTEQSNLPDEEGETTLDEDENIPWPDFEKVKRYWMLHGKNYIAGQRYFSGKPVTVNSIKEMLPHLNQRQRKSACLELALTDVNLPLINYRKRVEC